jgi:hypothetical protein
MEDRLVKAARDDKEFQSQQYFKYVTSDVAASVIDTKSINKARMNG